MHIMRLKTLEQQVVVVFGASSGIGRETVLRFAKRGAKVVAAARTESALDSLIEEIKRFGGEAICQVADAADFEQVKRVANLAVDRFGRLDTWAHVAGTAVIGPFAQTTPEEFKRVIEVMNCTPDCLFCGYSIPFAHFRIPLLICYCSLDRI